MRDYSLVTPDNWVFEFDSKYWTVDFGIPDGFGLPPIEHVTQKQFKQPGELLQDIHIGARLVTITGGINGDCLEELHSLRKRLFSALRWNRTNDDPPLPSQLRYRLNNKAAYLNCYYAGDVIANVGTDEKQQTIGIKLIAYDPLWYNATEKTGALALVSTPTVSYIIGKISGAWSAMGNPAAGAVPSVRAFALSPDGTTLYIGGTFTNWNGIANADYVAAYSFSTGTWSALGTGTDGDIYALAVAPNGDLYATGIFANAGGGAATRIARWNGAAWSALGAGLNDTGRALAFDKSGNLYVGGDFHLADGIAGTVHIAKWNGAAFSALGTGADDVVRAILVAEPSVYIAGDFANANGVACAKIARWNGTTFVALSTGIAGGAVNALARAPNGTIYAGGGFTSAGGVTGTNRIAAWNGVAWSPLSSGINNNEVLAMAIGQDGSLYVGGYFTAIGDLTVADHVAMWNGTAWAQLDVEFPGAPNIFSVLCNGSNIFFGFDTTGQATVPGATNITTDGDVTTYPILTITGPGTLQWIENVESGKRMIFDCYINAGETITIDLSPGHKTITSDWRGNLFSYAVLLPLSDFGSFALEPDPIAPLGVNTLNVLMTGTTPVEQNDNNNQLSNWANITGVTYLNTDSSGRLYASIIADGGGFYHVALYKDSARTELVGHTASYNGAGAKAIVADNASGLGGTVTVDAVTAADADIIVYFATGKIEWTDAYLSVDANVGV